MVLESKSIDVLGNAPKTWTDTAGRTFGSSYQLDKITDVSYAADGNQLTVRDLNNVGADMVYDSLDELLTSGGQSVRTDVKGNQTVLPSSLATGGSQLGFTWDSDNKLKSSDIDNNESADVTFEYDALGRRVA